MGRDRRCLFITVGLPYGVAKGLKLEMVIIIQLSEYTKALISAFRDEFHENCVTIMLPF